MNDRKQPLFNVTLSLDGRGYANISGPGMPSHSNWALLSCNSEHDLRMNTDRLSQFLHAAYYAGYEAAQDDIRKALAIK
jgi:hypothetical protein